MNRPSRQLSEHERCLPPRAPDGEEVRRTSPAHPGTDWGGTPSAARVLIPKVLRVFLADGLEGQGAAPQATVKPWWIASPATPNRPSYGELIRGEAETIASPQVPPVDVSDAPKTVTRNQHGDSDRSAH